MTRLRVFLFAAVIAPALSLSLTAGLLAEIRSLLTDSESVTADSIRALVAQLSEPLLHRRRDVCNRAVLVTRYTSANHTAQLVPLFAKGPRAELFGGVIDNDRVGQLLLQVIGR